MASHKVERSKSILFLLIFFTVIFILASMPRLGIPLGMSYVLYMISGPIVSWVMRLGIRRNIAIMIVFFGMLFLITFPIIKIVPMLIDEAEEFRNKIGGLESYFKVYYDWLRNIVKAKTNIEIGDNLLINIFNFGQNYGTQILKEIPTYLASILEWIFIVPFFLFFFLKDNRRLNLFLLRLTPNAYFERFYYFTYQFNKQLGEYIFAKFIEASIIAVITTGGLMIMGVKFAILLGVIAGLTNIIPYVGPFIGVIPAIAVGISDTANSSLLGILVLYFVANAIDIALIFPILVSKIVNIHPMLVVISVILGSHLWGLIGMVISIPLVAALKLIFNELYREVYLIQRK